MNPVLGYRRATKCAEKTQRLKKKFSALTRRSLRLCGKTKHMVCRRFTYNRAINAMFWQFYVKIDITP